MEMPDKTWCGWNYNILLNNSSDTVEPVYNNTLSEELRVML